jgi:hypothetical protein
MNIYTVFHAPAASYLCSAATKFVAISGVRALGFADLTASREILMQSLLSYFYSPTAHKDV